MTTYTWKIESVDATTNTMLVEFTNDGVVQLLNLHTPPEGTELGAWVDSFAPREQWQQVRTTVTAGATGTAPIIKEVAPAPTPSEAPVVVGNWNEEYLRALIYSVLEEVREQSV